MNIVHVSHTDAQAGAGRAAYRIHRSLLDLDFNSCMLVSDKRTNDATVHSAVTGLVLNTKRKVYEYLEVKYSKRLSSSAARHFSPSAYEYFNLTNNAFIKRADIICLYWINGAFINLDSLSSINKPLIWRLSDAWPFTGGCHYPGACKFFSSQCGRCPQLLKSSEDDISQKLWLRKKKILRDIDLTIVAPSHWMADLAKKSSLFKNLNIKVIPTGIDVHKFQPLDRSSARQQLGLPKDKFIFLFQSLNFSSDARKGGAILFEALKHLAQSPVAEDVICVTFGASDFKSCDMPLKHFPLGHINDDDMLAQIYSLADVVIVPSLEDNLPNVALEAMACGKPVVGFDVCGMPDVITHNENGFLIKEPLPKALSEKLIQFVEDKDSHSRISRHARKNAVERFSLEVQGQAYAELYNSLHKFSYKEGNRN